MVEKKKTHVLRNIIILIIALFIIFSFTNKKDKTENETTEETIEETTEELAGEKIKINTDDKTSKYRIVEVLNKGTEFEEEEILYQLPAGKYKVKNLNAKTAQIQAQSYLTQFNESGWEEPIEINNVCLIEPMEEQTATLDEGMYFSIDGKGNFEFMKLAEE